MANILERWNFKHKHRVEALRTQLGGPLPGRFAKAAEHPAHLPGLQSGRDVERRAVSKFRLCPTCSPRTRRTHSSPR